MKFYCESCGAKYSISDEKVRGKILKVRCKKCASIITVREPREPAEAIAVQAAKASAPLKSLAATSPSLAWFYSINGQSFGPYEFDVLDGMYASGEVGDASYVWNETMSAWKPVYEVAEFKEALEKGRADRPRFQTIGVTGQIEAIKPIDAAPSEEEEGFVPASAASNPFASVSGSTGELSDRLEALRSKLKQPEDEPVVDDAPEPEAAEPPREEQDAPEATDADAFGTPDAEEEDEDLDAGFVPPSASRSPEQSEFRGIESGQFSSLNLEKAPASSHDGMFAEQDLKVDDRDALSDDDFAPSQSLLINLEEIKKEGRKKRVTAGLVALLVFGGVGAVGYSAWSARQDAKDEEPVKVAAKQKDEIVFKTYGKKDLDFFIELEAEDLTGETVGDLEAEPIDDPVDDPDPSTSETKGEPKRVAMNTKPKKGGDDPSQFIIRGPIIKSSGDKLGDALDSSKKGARSSEKGLSTSGDGGGKTAKVDPRTSKGPKRDWGKLEVHKGGAEGSGRAIVRPEDTLGKDDPDKASFSKTKLTKDEATAGFRRVAKSVMFCREKQMQRAGLLDAAKIYVTVEIQGTGRVSNVVLEPASVRSSEFAQCMGSHKSRWRFAAYDGDPVKIKKMYIVQ